jgi:predicted ATPase
MRLDQQQEYNGLKLDSPVELTGKITAVIGRNGAGKSRLLKAIQEGRIVASVDGAPIPRERMQHLEMEKIHPSLVLHDDQANRPAETRAAIALYNELRGKFNANYDEAMKAVNTTGPHHRPRAGVPDVGLHRLCHVVTVAALTTGKDVNELTDEDITDFWGPSSISQLGYLNVPAIMRGYAERAQKNEFRGFMNSKEGGPKRQHWDVGQFFQRFGPPPWEVLNDLLRSTFDGRYFVNPPEPTVEAELYEPKFLRSGGIEMNTALLSSGERTLMWLVLIMYSAKAGGVMQPPRLLLLDEPDGTLHPQMIQNFHAALSLIVEKFDCRIIFSTHSPTTVALFNSESIYKVSETNLERVDKDIAIAELLVGVDQVSVHYTNRRQVYVESHSDAQIYTALFGLLKVWGKLPFPQISLSFSAAAPKLPETNIRQIAKATLDIGDGDKLDSLVAALNGLGNSVQVIGTVENLVSEGNQTVHGIIDWDEKNKTNGKIHVLGEDLFYSIENAVLNPLTLGFYLLSNHAAKIKAGEYGLDDGYDVFDILNNHNRWQGIADGVTKRVLGVDYGAHDLPCEFHGGGVCLDMRYAYHAGHGLEDDRIKVAYPFLKQFQKPGALAIEVIEKSIQTTSGKTLPLAFSELFGRIQRA